MKKTPGKSPYFSWGISKKSARHGTVTPIQGGSLGVSEKTKNVIEIEAFILTICESRGESTPHVLLVGG
jgi:hypothetical protein